MPTPAADVDPGAADVDPGATDVASAIHVRALGLDTVDADGRVVMSSSYYDSIDRVVDAVSDSTGAAPVVELNADGPNGQGPGTSYRWDGLTVFDSDRPAVMPGTPEWSVAVTGPTAGELTVSTAGRVVVGLSPTEVEALVPGAVSVPEGDEPTYAYGESDVTRVGVSVGSGDVVSHRVVFVLGGSPLALVEMYAPDPVGGH